MATQLRIRVQENKIRMAILELEETTICLEDEISKEGGKVCSNNWGLWNNLNDTLETLREKLNALTFALERATQ